jgi:hypothetical protein
MVFNTTINNISAITWQSVLLLEETEVFKRKPSTCHKSLTNFITYCCIKYTSPWTGFKLTTLVLTTTYLTGSCKSNYCEITFIRGVPIFVVFVGRLIHEIKNPTTNKQWNLGSSLTSIYCHAVLEWPQISGLAAQGTVDNFNDEISTSIPFNGLYENVCEWFDFECMCKNDINVYLWKDLNNFR